jgi:hypothetical protein
MRSTASRATAVFALLGGLFLLAAPAHAEWRRVDSPNFVVVGDVSARDLRDVAVKFEGFRETLGRLLGERAVATAVPTVVFVFPTDYTIGPFRPKYQGKPVDVAGLFMSGRDVNYIAIVNDGNAERMRIVFHEYAHLVTSNSGQTLPLWLSEGLAEYYSTFELWSDRRNAVLGNVIDAHLERLNDTVLIPIADLLKIDHTSPLYNEGSRRSVLYAQSWALTHYIVLGEPSRVPQLNAYLQSVWSGVDTGEAWRQAFGAWNMDRELDQYIRRQTFRAVRYTFGDALSRFDAPAAPLAAADVQALLAELLIRLDDHDAAADRLALSVKQDATSARARVGAVRLALDRSPTNPGAPELHDLATPTDWFLAYLAGVTAAEIAERRNGGPNADDIATVRRLLDAGRMAGEDFPNAVARLADLELRTEAGPSAGTVTALERARQRAPGRHEYALLLAQILSRQSEYAKARDLLAPFFHSHHPAHVRNAARSLMGYIVELEASRRPGGAPAGTPAGTPPGAGPPGSSSGASEMRPRYRQLQAGEQRLEGTLERIECVAGKGVTFHVKTADTTVTATTPQFNDVAFITYRKDLTGSIQCGPVTPGTPVYLTWRPGAEGAKIPVALEFLPVR